MFSNECQWVTSTRDAYEIKLCRKTVLVKLKLYQTSDTMIQGFDIMVCQKAQDNHFWLRTLLGFTIFLCN